MSAKAVCDSGGFEFGFPSAFASHIMLNPAPWFGVGMKTTERIDRQALFVSLEQRSTSSSTDKKCDAKGRS